MDAEKNTGGKSQHWLALDAVVSAIVQSHQETSKASVAAVDAYKTYLYRKGNRTVQQIEGIKAGQLIDLTELNAEIAAVEKTISMCEAVSLPTYEEVYKLKGLRAMRDQLVGRTWPSLADIKAQVQVEQQKAELEKEKKALALAAMKFQLQEQKAGNGPKWPPPYPKGAPKKAGAGTGLVHKYQQPGGPWKPMPKAQPKAPVEIGAALGRSKIDQEWIMRIGITSNLNVSILQENGGLGSLTLLRCKVCSCTHHLNTGDIVATTILSEVIETFCRTHRHDSAAPVVAAAGRLFRDEE